MENISLSQKRRSFNGVYDDVFGPKFGVPSSSSSCSTTNTLAPRLQDYSEIFGGSRSSSIPLLHLPLIIGGGDHLPSFLDYTDVFGGNSSSNRPLPFTMMSFQDLLAQSHDGDGDGDSSDDHPWSPAQSGSLSPSPSLSLSDELTDPPLTATRSADDKLLSDGATHHHSLETTNKLLSNVVSYNKSSQTTAQTLFTGGTTTSNFGYTTTTTSYETHIPCPWNGEDDYCSSHATHDMINTIQEFTATVAEEKRDKKSMLTPPLHCDSNSQANDFINPFQKQGKSMDKPFMTVSDISLRTRPSRLPPPSRPPPALVVKKGDYDTSNANAKLKASKSYAFERLADDSASLFFDVEVDVNVSTEGVEYGNKNVKEVRKSSKDSIERKDIESNSNLELEDVMKMDDKANKTFKVSSSSFEDEKMLQSHRKETTVSALATDNRIGSTKSTEKTSESQGVQYSNHIADCSAGSVAWTEATEYFEVIDKTVSRQGFETIEDCDTLMQRMNSDACRHLRPTYSEAFDQDSKKVRKEASRWNEKRNQPEIGRADCDLGDKQQLEKPNTRLQEKVILNKLTFLYDSNRMIPENVQQVGEIAMLQDDHETVDARPEAKGNVSQVEANLNSKASVMKMDIGKRFVDAQITKESSRKHKEHIVKDEFQRRLEDVEGAETRERVKKIIEQEGIEGDCVNRNKSKLKNEMILEESGKHGERAKESYVVAGHEKNGDERLACGVEIDKERFMEGGKRKLNESTYIRAFEHGGNEKEQELAREWEANKEGNENAYRTEDNNFSSTIAETETGNKREVFGTKGNNHLHRDASISEKLDRHDEESEPIEGNGCEREVKWDLESHVLIEGDQLKLIDGVHKFGEGKAINLAGEHDNPRMMEANQAAFSSEGNWELKTERSSSIYESESVLTKKKSEPGMDDPLVKGNFNRFSKNNEELQDRNIDSEPNNTAESPSLPKQKTDSNIGGIGMRVSCSMPDKTSSGMEYSHEPEKIISTEDDWGKKTQATEFIVKKLDIRDSFTPCQVTRESLVNGMKVEDASPVLEHNDETIYSSKSSISQRIERKEKNMKENLAAQDKNVGERVRRETELENEHMRKIEEEREREREREKDRMAVDKAAFEARERSFAEVHERAERAVVERASAEVRQRAMAEARERLEKASMEARLRAERAAVERATAEARQRAAEKAMADRAAFDSHGRADKFVSDRFSTSFRSSDTRQSSLSSDLRYQSSGISNGLRYSYASAHVGAEGESPQRCKARLERYRRTAERAANALAEKNRRDLLAQREREERNRVAESLDAEVKRWSSGKEGNLRALLSTLQYILGPGSGWQPVPLTEVITSAAVKKAYRKATLCVHPDKLQQRGATVQQKYICEKVFDLLKSTWLLRHSMMEVSTVSSFYKQLMINWNDEKLGTSLIQRSGDKMHSVCSWCWKFEYQQQENSLHG
ncbi:hypothetical protein BUALT_Bualt11G0000900 [Buddleja alternifolia]|uniref:Auxilin-like protein 1 n=1 Tax=Buddleja alternifolia TaxID=168488 RepID=A0AAV6WZG6_9LAMI|nr:hypothetical protein BUALT_Bualt11G0000900 [Buddleja alternifolia]